MDAADDARFFALLPDRIDIPIVLCVIGVLSGNLVQVFEGTILDNLSFPAGFDVPVVSSGSTTNKETLGSAIMFLPFWRWRVVLTRAHSPPKSRHTKFVLVIFRCVSYSVCGWASARTQGIRSRPSRLKHPKSP